MQVAAPRAVHPRMHPQEYPFVHAPDGSTLSVSDDGQIGVHHLFQGDALELEEEEEDVELEDDTRLRYQRLQARGRAAELAFNNRMRREKEDAEAAARSKSRSKSRSRPGTPILGALFKRDNFVLGITRSQSPPVSSTDKASRRPSVSNLFKLKPLSRSSSSKSIHNSSTSSSQATSPFPSPLTPLSPLPFFLSPKTRRKAIPNPGEDVDIGFGSPLARTPRRPSPTRAMTLPDNTLGLQHRSLQHGGVYPNVLHSYGGNDASRRDSSPLGRSNDHPATRPHLTYAD